MPNSLYTATPEEIPMAPITMMRNALGVAEGGSGVPLDPVAYRRSVDFWSRMSSAEVRACSRTGSARAVQQDLCHR